jgi:hypothetical protein
MTIKAAVARYCAAVPILLLATAAPALAADQFTLICTIDKMTDADGRPMMGKAPPFIFQVDTKQQTIDGIKAATFDDTDIYWLANPSGQDHVGTHFDINRQTHAIEVYFVDEHMNDDITLLSGTCKAYTPTLW